MKNVERLNFRPFTKFCMSIGAVPTSYLAGLTIEEQLLWLCSYLEKEVIPAVNNNAEAVEELQDLFIELKSYVDNYFDNLDVQEEINNKLDEMAEDGTLEEIIGEYLNVTYIIDEIETIEGYNEEHNTHYYVVKIPSVDTNYNRIVLKHGFANDVETAQCIADETPRSFAERHGATFCANASIFGVNSSYGNYNHILGPIINDGHLISNYNFEGADTSHISVLGVKEDNSLVVYPYDIDPQRMINDGCYTSFCAFEKRMENGIILTDSTELYQWNLVGQNTTTKDLVFICCNGKNINGEEGMTQPELLTILKDIYNCDFAYRLDCGGSTSYVVNSEMINQPTDVHGTQERKVPDYIYFAKERTTKLDNILSDVYNQIGQNNAQANQNKEEIKYLNDVDNNIITFRKSNVVSTYGGLRLIYNNGTNDVAQLVFSPNENPKTLGIWDNENNKTLFRVDGATGEIYTDAGALATLFKNNKLIENGDLNDIYDTCIVGCTSTTAHTPDSGINWIVFTLRIAILGAIQIAIPVRQDQSLTPWKVRFRNQTTIGSWYNLATPTAP